jgi:hypothetical protein
LGYGGVKAGEDGASGTGGKKATAGRIVAKRRGDGAGNIWAFHWSSSFGQAGSVRRNDVSA